ncbi:purple acid phosphatase family protein [Mangrovibacterium diazotrophicum]|uniref:Purple acid phosphatase-like protein n=1 Tax=Mangrovibacterium diazotrophicum TaxID=1261403 RepID=A0A419W5E6_9BACT|nr:metallophosphoesterase family protein [Mangrovibacterium diazotrophicum]RKD90673.1 purple acid phosphatase-like protein [Mangrovibacterium diazotrophicum]
MARHLIKFSLFFCLCIFQNALSAQKPVVYHAPKYEPAWMAPTVHPDRIMINYGADPTTTASVCWRTNEQITEAFAEIAKATPAPKFWRNSQQIKARTEHINGLEVKDAGFAANYHSVTFDGLEPNSLYAYRVGDGEHWSEWIQFRTASTTNDPFSFLYVGDAQNYILELWSRLIRQGFQQAPDARFIIHAGDLVSTAHSEQQWEEWFRAGSFIHSMVPAIPVAGNHEYEPLYEGQDNDQEVLSIQWRPQFALPENGPTNIDELKETTYFTDFQDVRIIALNSNIYHEEQAKWLKTILSNNPNRWTIITFHHPLYSASQGRDNEEWRNLMKPIFDEYGVDLVLQGHDHSYARGRVSPDEYNLTSGVNKRDQTGSVYVVSVSGGKMYKLRENGWENWEADQERAAENTQLVQTITVNKDTIHYRSLTATGDLYDAFDLVKHKNGPNTLVDLQEQAIAARYHHNTISYDDKLPLDIKNDISNKYPDFEINKIDIRENEEGNLFYDIRLQNGELKFRLKVGEQGQVLEEKQQN